MKINGDVDIQHTSYSYISTQVIFQDINTNTITTSTSNVNATTRPTGETTTLDSQEKELKEFYEKYDPIIGYHTAAVLGGMLVVLILFLFYKAKCKKWTIMIFKRTFLKGYKRKKIIEDMIIQNEQKEKPSILKHSKSCSKSEYSRTSEQDDVVQEKSKEDLNDSKPVGITPEDNCENQITIKIIEPDSSTIKSLPKTKTSSSQATAYWVKNQPLEVKLCDTEGEVYLKVQTADLQQCNSTGNVFSTNESSLPVPYLTFDALPKDWNKSLPSLKDPSGKKIIVIENAIDAKFLESPEKLSYLRTASARNLQKSDALPYSGTSSLLAPPSVPVNLRRNSDSSIPVTKTNTLTPKSVTINEASNSIITLNTPPYHSNHTKYSPNNKPPSLLKPSSSDRISTLPTNNSCSNLKVPPQCTAKSKNHLPLSPTINITTFDFKDAKNGKHLERTNSDDSMTSNSSDVPLLVDIHLSKVKGKCASDQEMYPSITLNVPDNHNSSTHGQHSCSYDICAIEETVL